MKVAYLLSFDHSGTTLLDLLLGSHSAIASTGRLILLDRMYAENGVCTCGRRLRECEHWSAVMRTFPNGTVRTNPRLDRREKVLVMAAWLWGHARPFRFVEEQRAPNLALLSRIAHVAAKPVVLDSSLEIVRLLFLHYSGAFDLKVIYLVRNGKAVLYSHMKKGRRALPLIFAWMAKQVKVWITLRLLDERRVLCVRYEELADRPAQELRRVCRFLAVPYEEQMLKFHATTHHTLGGNAMRFSADGTIACDERWKTGLSPRHQLAFDVLAGWVNRRIGVDAAGTRAGARGTARFRS